MRTVAEAPALLPQANDPCWCGSGRKYKRCHKPLEGRVLPGVVSPMRTVPRTSPGRRTPRPACPIRWDEPRVKSPEIIERMRHAGAVAAEVLRLAGEMVRARRHHRRDRRLRPRARASSAAPTRARSTTTASRRACARRSTRSSATASPTPGRCRTATSSTSTSPPTSAACTATPTPRSSSATSTRRAASSSRVTEECMWHGIEAVEPGPPDQRHRPGHRGPRQDAPLRRGAGVHRPRHRRAVPRRPPGPALLRRAGPHDHAAGHDVHDRADDHLGTWQHKMWDDDWTAVTADGKRTAQFEHTLLVTDDGVDVLTGGPGAVSPPRRGIARPDFGTAVPHPRSSWRGDRHPRRDRRQQLRRRRLRQHRCRCE